ncbi:DNA topoisomerase 3 [Enterococcus casseliflavus]|uniref:DNA topoisomerase 3 n=1 Tax=Enterococcus casseliflavus TaxID=37734 RepID=UPI00119EADE6|nr:DNA topoisomerase 3 [Enterococcus casseliflavus]
MTTVILAEKPNQAADYASALKHSVKKDGFFEIQDPLFSDETFITFAFGHLVELAEPGHYDEKWKNWALDALPIFPQQYDFQVAADKKKQFKIVSGLLKKADTIIIATDSDREGSNIAWSIIHKANAFNKNKTYKRLWINSLEKDVILDGFKHLKEGAEDIPAYQEAQTRQIADWLIGMNASMLYTLSLQAQGVKGTFSLGRVQTPTLYMIYQRQQLIEHFKKEPFYEIESLINTKNGSFKALLSPSQRFSTKEELLSFVSSKGAVIGTQPGTIKDLQTKMKKTNSPNLFSLSSLQSKINQLYKATAIQTLKAMQGLYEAKLLSYPRTDSPFITDSEFQYLKANYDSYARFLSIDEPMAQDQPRKRYVDGSKVQEHHAIIPTKQVASQATFDRLDDLQKKIYLLVMKTTIAMFLTDYAYEETVIETNVSALCFKATGKVPKVEGWKILFKADTNKESKNNEESQTLPAVMIGEAIQADVKSVAKETQPPKPFTEGTLLVAMMTANKTVDDEEAIKILQEIEGIGTEATRANIIETLKQKEYIKVEKNKLIVTEKGKLLCQAVESQHLLTSAEMTAKWEAYLKKIGKKEGNQETFIANIKKFIVHLIEHVPGDVQKLNFHTYQAEVQKEADKQTIGKCPKCGGNVVLKKSFYGCSNYPNCTFTLSDQFRKKKLTKTNLKDLLVGKETVVSGIKKADKTTYNAKIKLSDTGQITFVSFVNAPKKAKKVGNKA